MSTDEIARRVSSIAGQVGAAQGRAADAAKILVEPGNAAELAEVVRACETDHIALAPLGAARTLSQIRPQPVALGVSLSRLARVVAYEPEDMTITVEAGLSVGALNRVLAPARQRLPVDPCDPDATTVGALIAAAHAGPLRLSEGTARDLLIGLRYVGHLGRSVHGGGRVVKNVAGYDLMKVLGGSFGTLGIVTEATFKVRPLAERYALASVGFDRAEELFAAARELHDSLPLAHLEGLSSAAAGACGSPARFLLVAGISGSVSEVAALRAAITRGAAPGAAFVEGDEALSAYARLRDFDASAWALAARIAVAPAQLSSILAATEAQYLAHLGSGVATLFLVEPPADGRVAVDRWRQAARRAGGHLRVLHADRSLRRSVEFFDLPNEGALKLMHRLKAAFDPAGVFNPGCFVGGI
ncbi:MAG: FAD-binding oxidoreductase [Deltaproteobacteria bacterium]|nr:FAD-binding oxidoreductase [Deltaproteobacteria bacterium]